MSGLASTEPLTYVIPAHNEADTLEGTVELVAARLGKRPGSSIVIVENGSSDETWAVGSELASRDWEEVDVVLLRSEPGLASAYRVGATAVTGDHAVFTAADLPFGFSDLDAFAAAHGPPPPFAIGSKAHGESTVTRSPLRRVLSVGFYIVRMGLIGGRVGDPQGSIILRRDLVGRFVPETTGDGYLFGTELVALALAEGIRPVELPVTLAEELRPSTVRPVRDALAMLVGVVSLRRRLDVRADERVAATLGSDVRPGCLLTAVLGDRRGWRPLVATVSLATIVVALLLAAVLVLVRLLEGLVDRDATLPVLAPVAVVALFVLVISVIILALRHVVAGRAPPAPVATEPVRLAAPWGRTTWILVGSTASLISLVVLLWPILSAPTRLGIGSGDARYWYWLGWRLAEQVREGDLFPGGVPSVIWPLGYSLRPTDGTLPAAIGGLWNLLVPDPTLAFNLATATAVATTALAGVRLSRLLGADPWLAVVGGVGIATAPALAIRLEGHYNLLFAFPAILLVDLALRHAMRGGSPFPVLRATALLTLAYTSSGYYFVFGIIVLGTVLLASRRPRQWIVTSLVRCAVAGVLALVLLSPLLMSKYRLESAESDLGATPISAHTIYASQATSIFTPPDDTIVTTAMVDRHNDLFGLNTVEGTSFVGLLGLLGIGGLMLLRSRVTTPILTSVAVLWVVGLGVTFTAFGNQLPLGVRWLPATVLLELPGFAGVRALNRSSFVLVPLVVGAAVLVLSWVRARSSRTAAIAVVLLGATLVAVSIRVPTNSAPEVDGELRNALVQVRSSDDDGAVIHLPEDCMQTIDEVEMQIDHRRPVVGCQGFTSAIPWYAGLGTYATAMGWAGLRCEPYHIGSLPTGATVDAVPDGDAVGLLRSELGVGFVVFDTESSCPERAGEILDVLVDEGEVIGGDDRFLVIALPDGSGTDAPDV